MPGTPVACAAILTVGKRQETVETCPPSVGTVKVGNPAGGGIQAPTTARAGRSKRALNPPVHSAVELFDAGGQLLHTSAASVGAQYHTGRTVVVPFTTVVV